MVLLGPATAVALVLGYAGIRKVVTPAPTLELAKAALGRGIPAGAARAFGLVELLLGAGAVVLDGPARRACLLGVGLALALFAGLIERVRRQGSATTCGCFGARSAPPSAVHTALDLAFAGVALAAAAAGGPSLLSGIADHPGQGLVLAGLSALGAALGVAALTTLPEALFDARPAPQAPAVLPFALRPGTAAR